MPTGGREFEESHIMPFQACPLLQRVAGLYKRHHHIGRGPMRVQKTKDCVRLAAVRVKCFRLVPATTATRCVPPARSAASCQSNNGRFSNRVMHFGNSAVSEPMRLPRPAARMIASIERLQMNVLRRELKGCSIVQMLNQKLTLIRPITAETPRERTRCRSLEMDGSVPGAT